MVVADDIEAAPERGGHVDSVESSKRGRHDKGGLVKDWSIKAKERDAPGQLTGGATRIGAYSCRRSEDFGLGQLAGEQAHSGGPRISSPEEVSQRVRLVLWGDESHQRRGVDVEIQNLSSSRIC